ncbi:MAG: carbohydrate-binding domain-containing protein [Clostridia bacterium]|nr:carbohydrate-binding domain-containing protein [Clostridia bacterium]
MKKITPFKIISLVLCAAFACGTLAACKQGTGKNPHASSATAQSTTALTTQALPPPLTESKMDIEITCIEGTDGGYTVAGNTVTFTSAAAGSVYAISGEMLGNIVIDVGEEAKLELELRGLSLTSNAESAITVLSADKVTITAKKGYENFIYDTRAAVDESDETAHSAAIYAEADLDIGGKGALSVSSENNNGIHTKDDLEIKNLSLFVTCEDNALKGNDGVSVLSGSITLIARTGDGIKTSNSDISAKGNQRGNITVSGGTLNICAACDGMDAAHNVVIEEGEGAPTVNIYTDKYSEYSENVESGGKSESENYIRFTSRYYSFSVKYYNSEDDFVWVNAVYHSTVQGGRNAYYYFSYPTVEGYEKIQVFMYGDQAQGQDEDYLIRSDYITPNTAYDTFAITAQGGSYGYNWTNYSSSMGGGMGWPGGPGGPGGMQDGNSDKGEYSTKGIKAANEITISAGNITVKSYDDAIHAGSETALENGNTATGNINISGGVLTLLSNDDGVHADGAVAISGGTVNVTDCYEGIEGTTVKITAGSVSVVSKDDGFNSTAHSGTGVEISGGNVYVYAGGDGIDANSRTSYSGIIFSGGNTVVICTSGGNSAIDTEQGYKYTGGAVIAIMSSRGMTSETTHGQNFESIGTKKTLTLGAGSFLEVSAGGVSATVKMPANLSSSMVVYLGSNGASIKTNTSSSASLDANGVCWN